MRVAVRPYGIYALCVSKCVYLRNERRRPSKKFVKHKKSEKRNKHGHVRAVII